MQRPPRWFALPIAALAAAAGIVGEIDRRQNDEEVARADRALIEKTVRDLEMENPQLFVARCLQSAGEDRKAAAACLTEFRRRNCELPPPPIDPATGLPKIERTVDESIEYLKELERRDAICETGRTRKRKRG